jgi:pyruvate/2-oxoglutarate dehydrogenase complex dihydrolipoamide acyltransferase (E2) component
MPARKPWLRANVANLTEAREVSNFRRLATSTWGEPTDPTVYGRLDVDMTRSLAFLARQQSQSGEKITVTHLVGRCLAQCMREYPASNTLIRLNRFYQRRDVDIFFQVAITHGTPGKADDLSGVVVRQADCKSVVEIAQDLRNRSRAVRLDEDQEVSKAKNNLQAIPPLLLKPALKLVDLMGYTLNLAVPGMPRDPFGSAMVTSMGMFGIANAFAPLFPPSHCPIVVMVGAIERRPWVVRDQDDHEAIEVRDVMSLHVAFDHRIMDGVLAAQLTLRIEDLLKNPDQLDQLDAAQQHEAR